MKTEHILKADLLDIIFENRNKNYGAYALRKYYPERLYKALGISFLLIVILFAFSLLFKTHVVLVSPEIFTCPGYIQPVSPLKKEIVPVVEKPKLPNIQKNSNNTIFTSIIKLVDSTEISTKLAKNLDSMVISNTTNNTPGNSGQFVKGITGKETITSNAIVGVKATNKETPVYNADIMPSYPGGMDALIRFLKKNLHDPRGLDADETVSVKIMFIVGYDGVLKGFQTVEDGGAEFNNEVIRVLKKMPAWTPGKTAGENVSVYYTIPVKFVTQE